MKFLGHRLFLQMLVALTVLIGANAYSQPAGNLNRAEAEYERALGERAGIVEQLERLEDRYRGLVRKIDSLKSNGAMSTIGGRIELQNLLTQSKSLADDLDALQDRVRSLDSRIASQRSSLMSSIDGRIGDLERGLARASAAERRAAVAELNALRRRRSAYSTPLPEVPSTNDVSSALELAEQAAHPDELMAAADELQDTEDQIRKRLAAINDKLDELRKARQLARRARTFSREKRFFEETDRDRVIARYDRETRTPRESSSSDNGNSGAVVTGNENGQATNSPPEQSEPTTESFGEGNNAAQFDGAAAPAADTDDTAGREAPQLKDSAAGPRLAEQPASTNDPFETSTETIVIDGGGDPSRSVGNVGRGRAGLDGQIERLEGEQEKLEKQARELRKRARELREKAESM